MVLLLLTHGGTLEVERCEDVVHKAGCLVCVDDAGDPIVSLLDDDVLGYTLDPLVIERIQSAPAELELEAAVYARRRRRRA